MRNLRSFARLDEAEIQRADIREGLDSTLELLRGQTSEGITVEKEYEAIPEIVCYPGELNQVFLSLLTNACEAIEGSGTVRVEVKKDASAEAITIAIADTGRGMPQERLERLFDFDFSSGASRVKLGSSLATAHTIVRAHRGEIGVESDPGVGSVFTVRLPTDTGLTTP